MFCILRNGQFSDFKTPVKVQSLGLKDINQEGGGVVWDFPRGLRSAHFPFNRQLFLCSNISGSTDADHLSDLSLQRGVSRGKQFESR